MGKKIQFDFDHLAQQALSEIGDALVKQGRANMDKVSHGRVYVVGGKPHIASRVGDSPNNLSGDLKATIRYETRGGVLEYGSGNGVVDYAKYLEGNMNRPNITKSIMQSEGVIQAKISKLFVDSMRMV